MKIIRLFLLPLVTLLVVSMVDYGIAQERHVGRIVFAGESKLVISDVDDTNEVFVVAEDAKITRDGKLANLSDLAQGDSVEVSALRKNGKLVATAITATTGM